MPIHELRILPPLAIARFGSSPTPLEAYDLEIPEQDPMGFRYIKPAETLEVDQKTGEIARSYIPDSPIKFRDGEKVRPVAPFVEVYAQTAEDCLEPLTTGILESEGLSSSDLQWSVEVANLKAFRQTGNRNDKVKAETGVFSDHHIHKLHGAAPNFIDGRSIYFGNVRFIKPNKAFSEIRLRFTPAEGKVYGSTYYIKDPVAGKPKPDPVFNGDESRVVYDTDKKDAKWLGFQTNQLSPTLTNPNDIYEGAEDTDDEKKLMGPSKGYFDDVCDGRVRVELRLKNGSTLRAQSWISACMPAFAPDSQPVRTVADELEQLIFGPEPEAGTVSVQDAADIVRRALETIRLMNTAVMNANTIYGRPNIAHTLVTQDSNDYGRNFAPIMAASMVDNLAVRQLHERIYAALCSGSAPWFARVLRRPEEVGDLTDIGRRKMPPMLRGADGRALALTRRQINKILRAVKL